MIWKLTLEHPLVMSVKMKQLHKGEYSTTEDGIKENIKFLMEVEGKCYRTSYAIANSVARKEAKRIYYVSVIP